MGDQKEADARQPLAFSVRNIMMHSWSLTDRNDHRWDLVFGVGEPQLIHVMSEVRVTAEKHEQ